MYTLIFSTFSDFRDRYQDQAAFERHMSMPYFVKFAEEITPLILEEQELGSGQTIGGFASR